MKLAMKGRGMSPAQQEAYEGVLRVREEFIRDINCSAFGSMMSCMHLRLPENHKYPASIGIHGGLTLVISPKMFNPLPPEKQRGLIEHELGHVQQCLWRREDDLKMRGIENAKDLQKVGMAADAAVNQHIPRERLPLEELGGVLPENLKDEDGNALPEGMSFEKYLMRTAWPEGEGGEGGEEGEGGGEGQGQSGKGKGQPDDKDDSGTSSTGKGSGDDDDDESDGGGSGKDDDEKDDEKDEKDNQGDGEDENDSDGPGSVEDPNKTDDPHAGMLGPDIDDGDRDRADMDVQEMADKIKRDGSARAGTESANALLRLEQNARPEEATDWRNQFRRHLIHLGQAHKQFTYGRLNRRLGTPGDYYSTGVGKILLFIDSSGSMDKPAIQLACDQVDIIAKFLKVDIIVGWGDTEIKGIGPYNRKTINEIGGGGGTGFVPAFKWAEEQKNIQFMVYFTDGDNCDGAELATMKPKFPVLWALCGHYMKPGNQPWGREITLKDTSESEGYSEDI